MYGMHGLFMERILHTPIDSIWNLIIHELGLEGEQRDRVSELAGRYSFHNMGLRSELRMTLRELADEIARDDVNMLRIEVLIDSVTSLQGEIYKNRVRVLAESKDILTREQWQRVRGIFTHRDSIPMLR